MKICIYCHNFPVLSQTFVSNQIKSLISLGHDVTVMTNIYIKENSYIIDSIGLKKEKLITILNKNKKLSRVLSLPKVIFTLLMQKKLRQITSIIYDNNLNIAHKVNLLYALANIKKLHSFDYIFVHFGVNGYFIAKMRDLNLINGKIGVIYHGFELSRKKVLYKYKSIYCSVFNKCELLLPISANWKKTLLNLGAIEEKILIFRMGIFPSDFLKRRNTPFKDTLNIIQVGRLTEKKGVFDSIKAISKLPNNFSVKLTIVGEGDLLTKAKQLVSDLNINSKVIFTGKVPNNDVQQLLVNSDIFLLPSITAKDGDQEGIPVALMEAMAMGLIVISTYHSGIPELIQDKKNGFLVPEKSPIDICSTIQDISKLDLLELNNIRKNAQDTILDKYDYLKNNQNLLKAINNRVEKE